MKMEEISLREEEIMEIEIKLVNLTPHPIVLLMECNEEDDIECDIEGYIDLDYETKTIKKFKKIIEIPTSGQVARVTQNEKNIDFIIFDESDGLKNRIEIPVLKIRYNKIQNLPDPDPQKRIFYIVSNIVAQVAIIQGRPTHDLLVPGKTVRDKNGVVMGIVSFYQL
jgi:hypothetical protein